MRTHLNISIALCGLGFGFMGLAFAACERPADIFELDPLDSAPMASCWSHGPLQLACDACNGGDVEACLTVARGYEQRYDLGRRERDARTAALFYGRACVRGYAPGCVVVNDHYASVRGLDVPTRQVAAERRDHACTKVAAVCDGGKDPFACRVQGLCLAEDWPQRKAPRDVNAAAAALAKACDAGDAHGCAELGFLRLGQDGEGALAQAYAAHERGCKLESATSCVAAATQAQFGLGTPATPDAAQQQLSAWCERGNPDACNASRGYFASLRPLLTPAAANPAQAGQAPTPMPADPINKLELRPANVGGLGRVGYCVDVQGRVEKAEILDTTGAPALDDQILAHVKSWQLTRHPKVPVCAVHEQRVVFTFRSTGSRPFFTVWESWQTARGGTLLLDLDPRR